MSRDGSKPANKSINSAFWQLVLHPRSNPAALEVGQAMERVSVPANEEKIVAEFMREPAIRQIVEERYWPAPYTIESLAGYPAGTLGHAYHAMMMREGFQEITPPIPQTSVMNYIRLRSLQTHDYWHVVAGYGTESPKEAALQAFYLGQEHKPFGAVLISAGLMHAALFRPEWITPMMAGMAEGYERGKAAKPLFDMKWGESWHRPLAEIREELGITRGEHTDAWDYDD